MNLPVSPLALGATLALGAALLATPAAQASSVGVIATPAPGIEEIGARLRWGANGFEASVLDVNGLNQNPTLNPQGAPFWQVGTDYAFRVTFASATGTLELALDVDDNGSFGAGEVISRNSFAAPGLTSYLGQGFSALRITGNESGSAARSTVTNLVVNGVMQDDIAPAGGFSSTYYGVPGAVIADWTVTGNITFSTRGTAQERPSWNFTLVDAGQPRNPPAAVPVPAALAIFGAGLLGLGLVARRRA